MGMPAAKQGDKIIVPDMHIILVPAPPGPPVPTPPLSHLFAGGNLSPTVKIMGLPAATVGSPTQNTPPHSPHQGGSFRKPPTNRATIHNWMQDHDDQWEAGQEEWRHGSHLQRSSRPSRGRVVWRAEL